MSTYIFILGKDSELSIAELASKYPSSKPILRAGDFAVLSPDHFLSQQEFNGLGGQKKAGEVFAEVSHSDLVVNIVDHLSKSHDSGKLNYGISVYGFPESNLRQLLQNLKKEFRRRELSSRFANQGFLNISVAQHKGLAGGKEILICKKGERYYLAEVVAVQDIDAYSKRDYNKPFRDMKVGMLPPKLAQVMINLTGSNGPIWDPFCGGGVLVMEGLLMEYSMFGSDINAETLEGAGRNVDWISREFGIKAKADLFVHDATKPLPNIKFNAIACEGYLGPPQSRLKSKREMVSVVSELSMLYRAFFGSLKKSGFQGVVVIALPFYITRDGELGLEDLIKAVENLGFKKDLDLKYARHDQLVGRQILRFRLI